MLEFKKQLDKMTFPNIHFVLFPSFLYLSLFYEASYQIGSQNLSKYSEGTHTGEVLASQLKSLKVTYTLINHAETHEKQKNIIRKIKNATKEGIKVVLCFGEKSEKQDAEKLLTNDLRMIFDALNYYEQKNIILAYEPTYAIGSSNIIKPEKLESIIKTIKSLIYNQYGFSIEVIYGGSLNADNIINITNLDSIDGFLLGNSANNPSNIEKIIEKV